MDRFLSERSALDVLFGAFLEARWVPDVVSCFGARARSVVVEVVEVVEVLFAAAWFRVARGEACSGGLTLPS
jgi:hypothetical protein